MRFLPVWVVLLAPPALAQECVVPTESLVGKIDKSGRCLGIPKDFAIKYSIGMEECKPSPRPGHLVLGNCLADVAPQPPPVSDMEARVKRLEIEIERLHADAQRDRDDAAVRDLEIMSEFDFLKSGTSNPKK